MLMICMAELSELQSALSMKGLQYLQETEYHLNVCCTTNHAHMDIY
jgi:hypothetical protein